MDVYRASALAVLLVFFSASCTKKDLADEKTFDGGKSGVCKDAQVPGSYIVQWKNGALTTVVARDREDLIERVILPNVDEIAWAEPNYFIQTSEPVKANSTGVALEMWGQASIKADELWKNGVKGRKTDGTPVIVAVVDSGIDPQHDVLKNQIAQNPGETGLDSNGVDKASNKIDDDQNGLVDDVGGWDFVSKSPLQTDLTGHGTHVAGIIAASETGGPMVGVAPEAQVLPLRFIGPNGGGLLSDAINAMSYALTRGARVINASWGGGGCPSKTFRELVNSLVTQNVLLVAAAGNERLDISITPQYPASFDSPAQITVGAATYRGYTAGFSNYGKLVHVLAPGVDILSAYFDAAKPSGHSTYAILLGTSMAAPFVSGSAALLWSQFPQATVSDIKEALLNTVVKKNYCCVSTNGQIDVAAAFAELEKKFPPSTP